MSSLFNRLKSGTNSTNTTSSSNPLKKLHTSSHTTSAIEALLAENGPSKGDGNDKFFGMHNPSNTCYFNSVVQCLYYSEPFREHMLNFPARTPRDRVSISTSTPQQKHAAVTTVTADVETAQRINEAFGLVPPRRPANQGPAPIGQGLRPEDKEGSFEYLKKQAITNGPFLVMEGSNFAEYGMKESLFTSLKDLFEGMLGHDARVGVVSPAKFLEILRNLNETYRSPQHQDAHEFLNMLLNEVVEQVEKYSKSVANAAIETAKASNSTSAVIPTHTSSSWVHDLFEGTLTSETRCLSCENVSQRDEVFLDLSVDLDESTSVTSCLKRFSAEEMLCERNKFHCDRCCGLQVAEKRMKIKRLPRILALHLKRFKYDEQLDRLQKLFHRVVFPFYLRLLNTTDEAEDPDRVYELYAVIVHLGASPFHGHYVSIVKTKVGGWILFDDELVLPVSKDYVKGFFGGDARNPACAYVLFYQQTTEAAVAKDQEAGSVTSQEILTTTIDEANILGLNLDDTGSPVMSPVGGPKTPVFDPAEEGLSTIDTAVTIGSPIRPNITTHSNGIIDEHWAGVPPRKRSSDIDGVEETDTSNEAKTPGEKLSRAFGLRTGSMRLGRNPRTSSMSLRQKPKLFGRSDKNDVTENSEHIAAPEEPAADHLAQESHEEVKPLPPQRTESKLKSRFSLGREKSTLQS